MSQNNIRNNQNFNICNTTRRNGSTNNIKRKVKPGGSTLSRSIFAFLENRDNTNVDSNPTKTSMNLKNSAQGKFSNWPNASPLAAWRLRTLGPQQTERGTGGAEVRVLQVPPGGRTTRGRATQPQTPTSPVQTVARQRVSPRLSALPPRPPPPCCPSIIRIFSPHLLDTCMNEEIDK